MDSPLASAARYSAIGPIGSGGMATLLLGRMTTAGGFARLVAIKRIHEHLTRDESMLVLLLEEARLSAAIHHPNVVSTLDVVVGADGVSLIQEYIEGASLSALCQAARDADRQLPLEVAVAVAVGILRGLAAAHDTRSDRGEPLHIIHRDVSPQNVLVGIDGVVRLVDFGIARATGRGCSTAPDVLCGKVAYMAPEQLLFKPITAQVDVYAAGVVLWEMLTGRRFIEKAGHEQMASAVLRGRAAPPSAFRAEVPAELDRVVLRALAPSLADRYASAAELEADLAQIPHAAPREVGRLVKELAAAELRQRERMIHDHASEDVYRPRREILAELAASAADQARPSRTGDTPADQEASPSAMSRYGLRRAATRTAMAVALAVTALTVTATTFTGLHTARAQSEASRPAPPASAPAAVTSAASIPGRVAADVAPAALAARVSAEPPPAVAPARAARRPASEPATPTLRPRPPSRPARPVAAPVVTSSDPGDHL